ncbi:DUF11 domain-containing protein, partial [Algibacter mikhailovii]|uniref:DUF11 domain-containing protein n=1 Tax=Algibacter mikhailovii TaxID=425498 RepID=UPI0024942A17
MNQHENFTPKSVFTTQVKKQLLLFLTFFIFGISIGYSSIIEKTTVVISENPPSNGDYSINFSTGRPINYPIYFSGSVSPPVGRGSSPIHDASSTGGSGTGVESLAPEDMGLGQIVPFQFAIDVGDPPLCPSNGDCITVVSRYSTKTTSGDDFGYDSNLGAIAAFVDTSDPNSSGDTDATVANFSYTIGDIGLNSEFIEVTFQVCGLDPADNTIVVEVWMVLDDSIDVGITGNVQSNLESAITSGGCGEDGEIIGTGNQTVPLLRVKEFFTSDVDLSVTKSDDVDPIIQGGTIVYTVNAANAGPSVANDVVIYDVLDPNTTFVSASNGGIINTDPLDAIPDGAVQWNIGPMANGDSLAYTITVSVNGDAPFENTSVDEEACGSSDISNNVTIITISDDINAANDTDCEPTDVLILCALTSSTTKVDVDCFGAATGSIDLILSNDVAATYTYAWTGPNGFTAATEDISTLEAGTYNVVVTDSNGCSTNESVIITEPEKPEDAVTTAEICSGETYVWEANGGAEYTTAQNGLRIEKDGCTADLVLNLTVVAKPEDAVTTAEICSGETYVWEANGGAEYTTAQNGLRIEKDGCTADLVLNLTVVAKPEDAVTTAEICSGETYVWEANGGAEYTTAQSGLRIEKDGCTADLVLN